jgi:hypothetical protein
MREIESIVKDVVEIYQKHDKDAEIYLDKARKLERTFGPGLAIVYYWFYSVPQKWAYERGSFKIRNGIYGDSSLLTI